MNLHHLSNSAVPIHRADIASMLEAVVAMQRVTGEMALILTASLDRADGDPDIELNGDEEDTDGDERGDQAWVEWHSMRGSQKRGHNLLAGQEDDEEDDPAGQYDEDCYTAPGTPKGHGPGCPISDPDCEHDGREQDEWRHLPYGIDQTKLPSDVNDLGR